MAALKRMCPEPDDFSGAATAGATLPFLPTLVVAAMLGLGALCWDRTEPAVTPSVPSLVSAIPALPQMARMSLDPSPTDAGPAPRQPSAMAFVEAFPVSFETPAIARIEPRPMVRIARTQPACPGPRCRDGIAQIAPSPPQRPHIATGSVVAPVAVRPYASAEAEEDTFAAAVADRSSPDQSVPDRALPFAPSLSPTIRALQRSVGFVGSQAVAIGTGAAALGKDAVALCDSVVGLVDELH